MKPLIAAGLSLLALGACQRTQRTCDTAVHDLEARALAARTTAGEPPLSASDRKQSEQAMSVLIERCTKDTWAPDAIGCIDDATTESELARCMERLTPPQQVNLTRESTMLGDEPKELTAKIQVRKYAFDAFAAWASVHPGTACPAALAELDPFMGGRDTGLDPWGHPLRMLCGAQLPAGAKGIGVVSAGSDGQPDTGDDIQSWR